MKRTGVFKLDKFLKDSSLLDKHPEIFATDRKAIAKKLLNKFEKYTKEMNKLNDIDKFIDKLKKEYKAEDQEVQKIEPANWNEHYAYYDLDNVNDTTPNDMWVFPHNEKGNKLKINLKFYVNCIRLADAIPGSIQLANRNGHMMITGETEGGNKELGTGLSLKILILYNHKNKKWIVSPFKMVSETHRNVNCRSFGQSATTNDINRQFNSWKYGLEKNKENLGLVNYKYLDSKFRSWPNLFNANQSNQLLLAAKKINKIATGSGTKKVKKNSKKKVKKNSKKGGKPKSKKKSRKK